VPHLHLRPWRRPPGQVYKCRCKTLTHYGQKIRVGWAILFQSAQFALVHPFNSLSWPLSIFAAGLVYGLLTQYSQSIWPAVLVHIAYKIAIVRISFRLMPQFVFQAW
jgi:membrane protease YdiL (CAAX protease family)